MNVKTANVWGFVMVAVVFLSVVFIAVMEGVSGYLISTPFLAVWTFMFRQLSEMLAKGKDKIICSTLYDVLANSQWPGFWFILVIWVEGSAFAHWTWKSLLPALVIYLITQSLLTLAASKKTKSV